MWQRIGPADQATGDYRESLGELIYSAFRTLVISAGVLFYAAYLVVVISQSPAVAFRYFPAAVSVLATCIVTYRLIDHRFALAQLVWNAGFLGSVVLTMFISQRPEVGLALALLPLVATVMLGWQIGLLVHGVVTAAALLLSISGALPAFTVGYGVSVVIAGVFAGVFGWATARALLTALRWSLYSFRQAQDKMEEARIDRAELARVVKDLDQAYARLERANRMLVLARSEAEEAREARNRFALAISHELRTPLNFILGFSEMMVNSPGTYARLDEWPRGLYEDLEEIYRSSLHLSRLVTDVLDLGQIEALRMPLVKEWIRPEEIIREVEEMIRSAFDRGRLWVKTVTESDLPAVFADRTRVRQVLLNLVTNSLRVTECGGVTIGAAREEHHIVFWVEDTGSGIAQEDIPTLFEEFRHIGDGTWRRREGSGLGIPISRRFIELHGGSMRVESEVGRGTKIYFTIPLPEATSRIPTVVPGDAADSTYWQHMEARARGHRVVLALSSDPTVGEVIARAVEDYTVMVVQDPEELPGKVLEMLPTAVLVDQSMDVGERARSAMRALRCEVPIVHFAFPGSPAKPRDLPPSVSGYLVKPIGRHDLQDAVRNLGESVKRVLVVDDDPGMVRFVTIVLESRDEEGDVGGQYTIVEAHNGVEALREIALQRPDVVLLDLALPDLSGWEVLDRIRDDPLTAELPVILITAHDWPQVTARRMEDVLSVTLRRPLTRGELTPVLKSLLSHVVPAYPSQPPETERVSDPSE
ncbi:MAG: hybrid sensor histidine kinase/response regulator [Chloroflexi bacterium]|nr:hybrid sensor histidine kinase/response regulator [Chloroflexota bacterium]